MTSGFFVEIEIENEDADIKCPMCNRQDTVKCDRMYECTEEYKEPILDAAGYIHDHDDTQPLSCGAKCSSCCISFRVCVRDDDCWCGWRSGDKNADDNNNDAAFTNHPSLCVRCKTLADNLRTTLSQMDSAISVTEDVDGKVESTTIEKGTTLSHIQHTCPQCKHEWTTRQILGD